MPSSDTYFQPGHPKPPGSGRKAGTPNKRPPLAAPAIDHLTLALVPSLQAALTKMASGEDYERRAERYVAQVIRLLHLSDRLGPGQPATAASDGLAPDQTAAIDPHLPHPPIAFVDHGGPNPAIAATEDQLLSMGDTLMGLYQQMETMIKKSEHAPTDSSP